MSVAQRLAEQAQEKIEFEQKQAGHQNQTEVWGQEMQSQGLLDVKPDAYGLGINADQFGRPHVYRTLDGEKLSPIFQDSVQRNAYGLGVHADLFGQPVVDSEPYP